MRITMTTNIENEQSTNMILLPSTTSLEQTSTDDLDVVQPLSLPSPPPSNVEAVEPKLWLLRPPPFPPPDSSSSSFSSSSTRPVVDTEAPVLFEDLEQCASDIGQTLLTSAALPPPSSNNVPRSVAAASSTQIPNPPLVLLSDDDFTFVTIDFVLFDDDDPGLISPPTSPHSLFPSFDTH